jgi:hypothetical protein
MYKDITWYTILCIFIWKLVQKAVLFVCFESSCHEGSCFLSVNHVQKKTLKTHQFFSSTKTLCFAIKWIKMSKSKEVVYSCWWQNNFTHYPDCELTSLWYYFLMVSRETTNINYLVFGLIQTDNHGNSHQLTTIACMVF